LVWLPGTRGWVTAANFCQVLTLVRRSVLRQRPGAQLVIAMDSAAQHIADAAVRHAQRLRVHLLLIPGRVTWLLQPLDTHVFAELKRHLHRIQLEARLASASGVLPPAEWVTLLERAVRAVLVERDWSAAVSGNGLCGSTAQLRARVGDLLQGRLPLPLAPPDDAAMGIIVGRPRVGLAERLTRAAVRVRASRAALGAGAA
jgi:hypothetical protein